MDGCIAQPKQYSKGKRKTRKDSRIKDSRKKGPHCLNSTVKYIVIRFIVCTGWWWQLLSAYKH